MPDPQNVRVRRTHAEAPAISVSSRAVRLVRDALRAEKRLMEPLDEVHGGGTKTTGKHGRLMSRGQSQKAALTTEDEPATHPVDADIGRVRRERRRQRALAGWLATRLRAGAQERSRGTHEGPPEESDGARRTLREPNTTGHS
jgi:hypothetical protein